MKEHTKHNNMWVFWLELILAAIYPVTICLSMAFSSSPLFNFLEPILSIGNSLAIFARIPVGVIGIKKVNEMQKRQNVTLVLSVINLCYGILLMAVLIFILCYWMLRKASA